ncbi:MAG: DJ-1/PfpI family protein [Anaerotruncus sp.]|nr:DJ-1/PfpI family protein [Anaerotruncus sp.]
MVYVCLAEGFEEIEALAPVDVLRRAGISVATVGVTGKTVTGSHGIPVVCDLELSEASASEMEMLVLPGGMPGTLNLEKSAQVQSLLEDAVARELWVAAICAAPSILGHKGLLKGREAICFPGFEQQLEGAHISQQYVCQDGRFITARGMGVGVEFGVRLVEVLLGPERAQELHATLQCRA